MKKYILFIVLVLIAIMVPWSCGDQYPWATQEDCNDCISPKPSMSTIIIDLTSPEIGVSLKVYKGKYTTKMEYDDSQMIFMDTVKVTPFILDVPVNQFYSVVAEYSKDGKKYNVVDGSELRALSIESTCNSDCWIIKGGEMDCRLKF